MSGLPMNDYQDIISALSVIPADDREVWLRMGMAVKSALGDAGWTIWNDWSRLSTKYNARDARDVWRSIKPGGGVTAASLFKLSKDQGWKPDKPFAVRSTLRTSSPPPIPNRRTADYALTLWECVCCDDAAVAGHPYSQKKGITHAAGAGRGVASGKLVGSGADCIVIPVRDEDGDLVAVECINSEGIKQSFGTKSQGYLILGNTLDRSIPWAVLEGWADAATWVFTMYRGNAVGAVAFGESRLRPIAEDIACRYQPDRIFIPVEPT